MIIMKRKYTPLPWAFLGHLIFSESTFGAPFITCEPCDEMVANAAFIVKAANHHDGLVAILEEVLNSDCLKRYEELSNKISTLLTKVQS